MTFLNLTFANECTKTAPIFRDSVSRIVGEFYRAVGSFRYVIVVVSDEELGFSGEKFVM